MLVRSCIMVKFVTQFQIAMRSFWHMRPFFGLDPRIVTFPFFTSIVSEVRKRYNDEELEQLKNTFQANDDWIYICANCGKQGDKEYVLKFCARYKVFSYCSQECQVKHRKAGHKVDCKGHHWIESYFPKIRTSQQYNVRAQLHKYNPWKE